MKINDGGPAFPVPLNAGESYSQHGPADGMTLRDAFAIAALTSGEAGNWRDNQWQPHNGKTIIENSALCAYDMADAMIKARSQGESNE